MEAILLLTGLPPAAHSLTAVNLWVVPLLVIAALAASADDAPTNARTRRLT